MLKGIKYLEEIMVNEVSRSERSEKKRSDRRENRRDRCEKLQTKNSRRQTPSPKLLQHLRQLHQQRVG